MNKRLKGSLMLLITAFIFGSAFVAQKSGMELLGPLAFSGIRTTMGGFVLIPVIFLMGKLREKKDFLEEGEEKIEKTEEEKHEERKALIKGGICCGLMLFISSSLQQIGLFYTTTGKAGFITALYVIIVPVLGLLLKRKVRPLVWCCVFGAAAGLYFLCIPAGAGFGHINMGDVVTLFSSLGLATHLLLIDHFSPKVDGVKLSCMQFFVAGIISLGVMYPVDTALGFNMPTIDSLVASAVPLLYAGVLSCGVAYTFQVIAQAYTGPTETSLILSLESVFAALSGFVVLGESMTGRELFGCIVMFAVIVAAQLPSGENKEKIKNATDG
ncbi:MAG: DMT family transporter [Clostridiales bacterium]|nr:DMT family transporter [Clostridiales bacterium]